MVAYRCCFDDGVGSNVNVVSDLHRIVIEISAVRFVRRPSEDGRRVDGNSKGQKYLMIQLSPTRQYLPKDMTTACPGPVLLRSPRMIALLDMMVLPPRMMFCGPAIVARRETLLPVSFERVYDLSRHKRRLWLVPFQ